MAPPILQGTAGIAGNGSSVAIPADFTSPTSGNYRVLALFTNDTVSGVPVTANTPNGWVPLYVSPRGRSPIRCWLWGQTWQASTPSGTISFNHVLNYLVLGARLENFTKPPWTALITTPGPSFEHGTLHDADSLLCQADSVRIDFWGAFYLSGANNTGTTIGVPTGQTGSSVFRSSTSAGYVGRVSYETLLTRGLTGTRVASLTDPFVSAALSIAIGGWKDSAASTLTTMDATSSVVGSKAVTRSTTTTMGLVSSSVGSGRSSSGDSTTELALDSTAMRVYLTSTELALTGESVGTHDTVGTSTDNVGLAPFVTGTHIADPVDTTTVMALSTQAIGRVGGGGATPSLVDQYTEQYVPPLRPLRFMFQRIRDGQWLNWDVPLVDPEITWTLSGPTVIRGKIGPEDNTVVQGIDAWGTWLHVEESGLIRASAILQPLALQGDDLTIEAVGVHGYAVGTQFESEFSAIQIDAAEAMRQLWAYLQHYSDARLGVTLDPTMTGRLLGEPARVDIRRNPNGTIIYKKLSVEPPTSSGAGLHWLNQGDIPDIFFYTLLAWGYPLYQNVETGQFVILVHPMDYAMVTTGRPARRLEDGSWEVPDFRYVAAEPYQIAWWNEVDVGREIENLAKETPFDFTESPRWADSGLDVQQHISIGYPRLGTRRFDLRFAEDENLFAAVLLRESPNWYANQVIVRGAGEGRVSVRAQAGGNNPNRIRRVASLTDKTITDPQRALTLAIDELYRRLAAYTISEITIDATHDNAPLGSFAIGDDILVQAQLPYYGEVALWHRIVAYTWRPDLNEVSLQLRRSEQFTYGEPLPAA